MSFPQATLGLDFTDRFFGRPGGGGGGAAIFDFSAVSPVIATKSINPTNKKTTCMHRSNKPRNKKRWERFRLSDLNTEEKPKAHLRFAQKVTYHHHIHQQLSTTPFVADREAVSLGLQIRWPEKMIHPPKPASSSEKIHQLLRPNFDNKRGIIKWIFNRKREVGSREIHLRSFVVRRRRWRRRRRKSTFWRRGTASGFNHDCGSPFERERERWEICYEKNDWERSRKC